MKKPPPEPTHGGARAGAGRKPAHTKPVLIGMPLAALRVIDREVLTRKRAREKPAPTRGTVIAERFPTDTKPKAT